MTDVEFCEKKSRGMFLDNLSLTEVLIEGRQKAKFKVSFYK